MGISDWWCSPPEIAQPLYGFWGVTCVDPCSNPSSIIKAHLAMTEGGLVRPWYIPAGHPAHKLRERPGDHVATAYENPPYSVGDPWAQKAIHEVNSDHVDELIRLTMMSTSTAWWASVCYDMRRNPRILGLQRLRFIDPRTGRQGSACRFEPALTYVGPRPELFTREFSHLTRWSTWGR